MPTPTNTWLARLRAIRKVAAEYGLDGDALATIGDALATIGEVARSPAPERSLDRRRERQNQRDGITQAFASNAAMDRVVPSHTPEPGVVHRHVG